MAVSKNTSEASHLTRIGFDISQIATDLANVEQQLLASAQKINTDPQYKLKLNLADSIGDSATKEVEATTNALKTQTQGIKNLNKETATLVETTLKYNEASEIVGATTTTTLKNNTKIIEQFAKEGENYSLVSGKVSDGTKATLTAFNNQQKSIESLSTKYQDLGNRITATKDTSKDMVTVSSSVTKNINELNSILAKGKSSGAFTDEEITKAKEYEGELKKLKTQFTEANKASTNLLSTITDKARWLLAFYFIQTAMQAFKSTVGVIKETEDRVIELQRVLGDGVETDVMQQKLYDLAIAYGRSFEEVSETAVKFAQTGQEWNEALKSTEATMLAVNTAELDVTQATTGLIAVMSQFNVDTEDMVGVIDKINITADNFAVTSEKIVSALQRAGSSAKSANLSLEETIAVITTLSEATGRSGEVIGTATNSLIAYTQKAQSLEVFASLSTEMANLVDDYNNGSASIVDIWIALSSTVKSLNSEQEAILNQLAQSDDYSAFVDQLETEAGDVTEQIRATYDTAGTMRKNYFIALLENFDDYEDKLGTMASAEGYSLSENEKYMATLTSSMTQLTATAEKLAAQFGEDGFLTGLKILTTISTGVLELVYNLGGLNTVLGVLITIVGVLKKEAVGKIFISLVDSVILTSWAIQDFIIDLEIAAVKGELVTFTMSKLKAVLATLGPAGVLGVLITGFSLLNGIIDSNIRKIEERMSKAREEISTYSETTKKIQEETEAVQELINEYKKLANAEVNEQNREKILELQKKIATYSGTEFNAQANTTKELERQLALTQQKALAEAVSQENLNKIDEAYQDIQKQLENAVSPSDFSATQQKLYGFGTSESSNLQTLLTLTGNSTTEANKKFNEFLNTEDLEKRKDILVEWQTEFLKLDESAGKSQGLEVVSEKIAQYNTLIEDGAIANEAWIKSQSDVNLSNYLANTGLIQTTEDLNKYIEIQKNNIDLTEEQRQANIDAANSWFYYLVEQDIPTKFGGISYSVEEATEKIENLNNEIDTAQSNFQTMFDVMDEYNSTGRMSIDMVQQLLALDGEYFASLQITANGISMVDKNTGQLVNSTQDMIKQLIVQQGATQLVSLAQHYLDLSQQDTAESAVTAKDKNEELNLSLQEVLRSALTTAGGVASYANEVRKLGEGYGLQGDYLKGFQQDAANIIGNLDNMYDSIGGIAGSATDMIDGATTATETQTKALETQKKAIEDRYNAEIEALKKVEKENDRIRAKEEYERRKAELSQDLASVKARSGIEYREQESDLREDIAESEREWQEQLEDWSIEDKIAQLEALRDSEIALIDSQIDAIKNGVSSVSSSIIQETSKVSTEVVENFEENVAKPVAEGVADVFSVQNEAILTQSQELGTLIRESFKTNLMQPLQVDFLDIFGINMKNIAELSAKQTYEIYSANFTTRLANDINTIFSNAYANQWWLSGQSNAPTTTYSQVTPQSNQTYNNSRSMNMLINANNNNNVSKITSSAKNVFDISTLPF